MPADLAGVMYMEVPIIVVLAERMMHVHDIVALVPGAVIELPKSADDELALLVNNKQVGAGTAVKVGENFGIRITYIGDLRERISAMGARSDEAVDSEPESPAEQMVAG
ncbi:MAG: FliM/FliN family flagellar motor C-terminal domain-containing protein [Phycisphaerales bacterium]